MSFYETFRRAYKSCPPVGYLLRERFQDSWLRIHSLPHSKRYPDNQEESKEVLLRHLKVIQYVLGDQESYVFMAIDTETKEAMDACRWYAKLKLQKEDSIDLSEDDSPYIVNIYGSSVSKDENLLSEIVLDIANDKAGSVVFFSPSNNSIYAPYDGGADLFFMDSDRLETAKRIFRDWTSDRLDGL